MIRLARRVVGAMRELVARHMAAQGHTPSWQAHASGTAHDLKTANDSESQYIDQATPGEGTIAEKQKKTGTVASKQSLAEYQTWDSGTKFSTARGDVQARWPASVRSQDYPQRTRGECNDGRGCSC